MTGTTATALLYELLLELLRGKGINALWAKSDET